MVQRLLSLSKAFVCLLAVLAFTACSEIQPPEFEDTPSLDINTQVTSESAVEDGEYLPITPDNIGSFSQEQLDTMKKQFQRQLELATELNDDVKAWLHIEPLGIDQPVVVPVDNEQYIRQGLDGGYSEAGTLFFDQGFTSFDDKNLIIYGHNMKDGSMFAPINNLSAETDSSNCVAILTTSDAMYFYVPASLYTTENLQGYIVNNPDNVSDVQVEDSEVNYPWVIAESDHVLTLSTCDFDGSDSNRRVMQFVRW